MPVKWKILRRALEAKGITVSTRRRSGEARIKGPDAEGNIRVYILQHQCCRSPNAVVWTPHQRAIMRRFGLTDDDLP